MLQKARANHRQQVEDIEKINKEKDEKIAAEEKKLKAQLEVIEKKANEEMKNLDDDKKARVEQLLKKNKDNPAALAKRLSELTGLSFNENDVE
jgi:predicted transcriptional regulator